MQGFRQLFFKYFFNIFIACFRPILDINNMPLFVDKGMLSGDKIGLFFLEVTSMEEMNFFGRDELFWKR